jgi:uncharacterized protein YneF (UPF0154 family)
MSDYNPNTTPTWLAVIPMLLGIVVVIGIIVGAVVGVNEINQYLDDLSEMAGQTICL